MVEKLTGELKIKGVLKTFGQPGYVTSIESLEIAAGSLVTIVGDSGSGKTTLLRLIAGLLTPDRGTIWIDGQDATALPLEKRGTPYIPQDSSLLPHLTVQQNVAFPLGKDAAKPREQQRIEALLITMNLEGVKDRYPAELSAGQAQRVAIARALTLRPRILLLDEPTANLDPRSRDQIRLDLKNAQRRLGMSILLVTHDPVEAMSLGEKILVMSQGKVEALASPEDMYFQPRSEVCARALGDMNVLDCPVRSKKPGKYQVEAFGKTLDVSGLPGVEGTSASLLLRPECLGMEVLPGDVGKQVRENIALVLETEFCGEGRNYLVETIHGTLKVRVSSAQSRFLPGEFVKLRLDTKRAWMLPGQTS